MVECPHHAINDEPVLQCAMVRKTTIAKPKKKGAAPKPIPRNALTIHLSASCTSTESQHVSNFNTLLHMQSIPSCTLEQAKVQIHSQNLLSLVVREINGCSKGNFLLLSVAWLTDMRVLLALASARRRGCYIQCVVQKENYLKYSASDCKKEVLDAYNTLGFNNYYKSLVPWFEKSPPLMLNALDNRGVPTKQKTLHGAALYPCSAVRVFGSTPNSLSNARALMHEKTAIVGRRDSNGEWHPTKVLTGSFNFTFNSSRNVETVVSISDSTGQLMPMLHRFGVLLYHSEPLNDFQNTQQTRGRGFT